MKITAKQYAQYLYQIVSDKENDQIKDVIEKFAIALKNNNDLVKANQIIKQFIEIWNFEKKIVEAEIISAKELDINIKKVLIDYIKELSKANEIIIKEKIDQNLLGGVIIKYGDKVLNGSLRNNLTEMRSRMIK
ncbi:MAG: ATP synthase F1 subunit delta [bacterium]|nr:ATP synthase F1 subunit delta [bacterium]